MRKKSRKDYKLPVAIILSVVGLIVSINIYLGTITSIYPTFPTQEELVAVSTQIKESKFLKASELQGIVGYINTDSSISLQKLREENKVVLIDFWTYTCINCQRTIPYLNSWYEKYSDDGFVIVGVHSPEFEFEKDYNNVQEAVKRFGIKYPVVQDNDFKTWRAYGNNFWPRKYLIDVDGFIRYDHIGEGAYAETESIIQKLLKERSERMNTKIEIDTRISKPADAIDVDYSLINTPEIYFGYRLARAPLGNEEGFRPEQVYNYTQPAPEGWKDGVIYLGGEWYSSPQYIELKGEEGFVGISYSARDVNIVAGGNGTISVWINETDLKDEDRGRDVIGDIAKIDENRLYNLVSSKSYGVNELNLMVRGNVRIYTFTFG